jgi:hypothetical protein
MLAAICDGNPLASGTSALLNISALRRPARGATPSEARGAAARGAIFAAAFTVFPLVRRRAIVFAMVQVLRSSASIV